LLELLLVLAGTYWNYLLVLAGTTLILAGASVNSPGLIISSSLGFRPCLTFFGRPPIILLVGRPGFLISLWHGFSK